jgi:hypothetical protein
MDEDGSGGLMDERMNECMENRMDEKMKEKELIIR